MGIAVAGCRQPYREPSLDEPHALVKVRIKHHEQLGPRLDTFANLDEETLPHADGDTFAIRVRPKSSSFTMGSTFWHSTTQLRTRQVSESYPCGTNYGGSTRYCTRYRTETRSETVRVVDASCSTGLQLFPRVGSTYLLQYDFYGHQQCQLKCFLQTAREDGAFDLTPCEGT
ncbi:MAG: hypothetical protein ACXVEF_19970 [Polyangiales bacterium]